jgi:hypothetical protein
MLNDWNTIVSCWQLRGMDQIWGEKNLPHTHHTAYDASSCMLILWTSQNIQAKIQDFKSMATWHPPGFTGKRDNSSMGSPVSMRDQPRYDIWLASGEITEKVWLICRDEDRLERRPRRPGRKKKRSLVMCRSSPSSDAPGHVEMRRTRTTRMALVDWLQPPRSQPTKYCSKAFFWRIKVLSKTFTWWGPSRGRLIISLRLKILAERYRVVRVTKTESYLWKFCGF